MANCIISYNVGFGNACFVKSKNHAIIIDFGSTSHRYASISEVLIDVKARIQEGINDNTITDIIIIITHLHADHYNLLFNHILRSELLLPWLADLKAQGPFPTCRILVGGMFRLTFPTQRFLAFLRSFDFWQIVPPNCLMATSSCITDTQANQQKLPDWIQVNRVNNDPSKADQPLNENGIVVRIHYQDNTGQDKWLIFMGDAPYDLATDPKAMLNFIGEFGSIFWYEAPHHGSSADGAYRWLIQLQARQVYIEIICISTLASLHPGIPNIDQLIAMYPGKFRATQSQPATSDLILHTGSINALQQINWQYSTIENRYPPYVWVTQFSEGIGRTHLG